MDSELREDLARMRRESIKASEAMNEAGRMVIALKRDLLEAREEMERMDSCAQVVVLVGKNLAEETARADTNDKAMREADRWAGKWSKALASTRARIRRLHTMYVEDRDAAEEGTDAWEALCAAEENIARLMGPEIEQPRWPHTTGGH